MSTTMVMEKPAIAGGERAKTTPYGSERRYGEDELRELTEALEQGTLFYAHGRKVHQLEADFAAACGVGYAVACGSGTAAIHAALIAAGISPGDEVITGPITDMGTVIPILYQGAVPVFADLLPQTYNLDPASVEARITAKTQAILAIHLAGNACDLRALSDIAARHSLTLIEDCAQALGCHYDGQAVGTRGQFGCYSLNEFKHISCGDGGIVITDDEEMAAKLRLATDKCYDRRPNVTMRQPWFLAPNTRMTELQGAVAVAQLRKLDSIAQRRRDWCGELSEHLQGTPGIRLPEVTEGCEPSWWFYLLRVDEAALGTDADTFAAALRAEGMPASVHYIGQCVYEYPIFTQHSAFERGSHAYSQYEYAHGLCPEAEAILRTCIQLSINQAYTPQDCAETAYAIQRAANWYAQQ